MNFQKEVAHDQRREEELFLITVHEGITDDIKFVERGGVPSNWRGCSRAQILEKLRHHHRNVSRAIRHVREGGALTDIVPIVWGTK